MKKLITISILLILASLYIIWLMTTPKDLPKQPAYKTPVYTPVESVPVPDYDFDYDNSWDVKG